MAVKDDSMLELLPHASWAWVPPPKLSSSPKFPSVFSVASSSAQASGFQGTSAAKHSASSGCTHSKRNAPAMSRLANSISTPGSCDPHQSIWRATCLCLGCKAGGWRSDGHNALMARWSCMSLRSCAMVRSGFCFATVAKGLLCVPCWSGCPWGTMSTRPLCVSFHTCW
eukprot:6491050-Amphidinium_carterae.1